MPGSSLKRSRVKRSSLKRRVPNVGSSQESVMGGTVPEKPASLARLVAIIVLVVALQATVAPYLIVLGTKPDSALVIVVCLALMRGPVWGAVIGFTMGLMLDIALLQTMGISSFLFTLAGYFSGRYAEGVDPDSWFPPIFMVFLSTTVFQLLNAVIMFLIGVEASLNFVIFRVVLPSAILNALLAAPAYVVCRWWLGTEFRQQNVFADKQ